MASLKGKVIAITGAASGMGKQLAILAGTRGAKLALADVQPSALDLTVQELRSSGVEVIGTVVNIASFTEVDSWINSTVQHFGRLDGAANIAGVTGKNETTAELTGQSNEEWDFIISINLTGLMYLLRAQLRVMTEGAAIVNAASIVGLTGRPGMCAYSVSKHGAIGLTRSAAKEVGRRGIRVNAVAPGAIDTPMLHRLYGEKQKEERPLSAIPMIRNGKAIEVAQLCAFLLSDESSYITGAVYPIDGGVTA